MKTKITITVSIIIALAIGFVAGKMQATTSLYELFTRTGYERVAGDAVHDTTLLTQLRSGHQDSVIKSLEQSLDDSLFSLDHYPQRQWTPSIHNAIVQVRAYRVKYPWDGTDSQMEPSVQRVLK
jgi:hypothetical protein